MMVESACVCVCVCVRVCVCVCAGGYGRRAPLVLDMVGVGVSRCVLVCVSRYVLVWMVVVAPPLVLGIVTDVALLGKWRIGK